MDKEMNALADVMKTQVTDMNLKQDLSTGGTPKRKEYVHPSSWDLTRDHEHLLEQFRQIQEVMVEASEDEPLKQHNNLEENPGQFSTENEVENDRIDQELPDDVQTKLPVPRRSHRKKAGILEELN